jgi:hypothetical protein
MMKLMFHHDQNEIGRGVYVGSSLGIGHSKAMRWEAKRVEGHGFGNDALQAFCTVSLARQSSWALFICDGLRIMGIGTVVRGHVPSGGPCQSGGEMQWGGACGRMLLVFWLAVVIWGPSRQS